MTWVRLDDGYYQHPKVRAAGEQAAWMNVVALCWSNANLTDGFVPAEQVQWLTKIGKPAVLAQRLVAANMWEPVEGGFRVHDFLHYQFSAEQIRTDRDKAKTRMAGMRARRRSSSVRANSQGTSEGVQDLPSPLVLSEQGARPQPAPVRDNPDLHIEPGDRSIADLRGVLRSVREEPA
jgi:hypothetical protein